MSGLSSLGLFGVIHMDRRSKVTAELGEFLDGADAVFIEYPRETGDVWMFARLLTRAPVYLLGAMCIQLFLYTPQFILFVQDLLPAEMAAARTVTADRDIPTHRIDEHPNQRLQDAGPRVIVANWAVLAGVVWLDPLPAVGITAALVLVFGLGPVLVRRTGRRCLALGYALLGLAAAGGVFVTGYFAEWVAVAGMLTFFVVILTTVGHRNEVMLDRVESLSAEHGYDDAVLVTGKGHLGGLVRLAGERGLYVRAAHVSAWLREGTTHTDLESAALPEVGRAGKQELPGIQSESDPSVVGRRVAAAVVDAAVGVVIALGGLLIAGLARDYVTVVSDGTLGLMSLPGSAVVWVLYYVSLEAGYGQTIGKRLFGLRVVQTDGDPLTLADAALRNVLRPLGVLSCYGLGFVTLLASERSQHLGDIVAGTVVGKTA